MWLTTLKINASQTLSKSRPNHRSCAWTQALTEMVFLPAQKLSGIVWTQSKIASYSCLGRFCVTVPASLSSASWCTLKMPMIEGQKFHTVHINQMLTKRIQKADTWKGKGMLSVSQPNLTQISISVATMAATTQACCPKRLQVLQGHDIKAAYQLRAVKNCNTNAVLLNGDNRDLKIEVCTSYGKQQTVVCGFMLPVCSYLRLELREWNSRLSRFFSFFRSVLLSQTWDCDALGSKKPCGKSLTSREWSKNFNIKLQTWRQGTGQVTSWRSRFAGNVEKPRSLCLLYCGTSLTSSQEKKGMKYWYFDTPDR